MNIFNHNGSYNANQPVLIFTKKSIGKADQKIIEGVAKNGGGFLEKGDVITSNYISTIAVDSNVVTSLPYKQWVVVELVERSTPKGHFIVDINNAGFTAIIEPYTKNNN